ncbi:hypothetical protein GCM10009731_53000 [Streptomyces globosus]
MTAPAVTAPSAPNLTNLESELSHRHRPGSGAGRRRGRLPRLAHRPAGLERGLQEWHIRILADEEEVGSLRAARWAWRTSPPTSGSSRSGRTTPETPPRVPPLTTCPPLVGRPPKRHRFGQRTARDAPPDPGAVRPCGARLLPLVCV